MTKPPPDQSSSRRLALFGGSFNPPGTHHLMIARELVKHFDEVLIVPCGPRPDKPETNEVAPVHRAAMVDLTFRDEKKLTVDLFDLEARTFTPNVDLQSRYEARGEISHVVGSDLIDGGAAGDSPIQSYWHRGEWLWQNCRFVVLRRPGFELKPEDLPPHSQVLEIDCPGSSSRIRQSIESNQPIDQQVIPDVYNYMDRHALYRVSAHITRHLFRLPDLRPKYFINKHGEASGELGKALKSKFGPESKHPNVIIVVGGDGTMLHAIRQHWKMRIPFYGVNAGHRGFLLNRDNGDALLHELVLEHLPLLWVETTNPDGECNHSLAFNDAWIERATGQTAWIQVKVNGQDRLPHLVADGSLVATAAGSTSYAAAMGATPLPFNTPSLLLVGSNVLQPEFWKPVVLPVQAEIELNNRDPSKRPLRGFIDGVPQGEVVKMRARISNIAAVELAFDPSLDPAEKLAQIQFPPPAFK